VAANEFDHVIASLDREETVQGLLRTTCRVLVEFLDGSACAISRVVGDLLIGLAEFSRVGSPLGHGHEFLISDYPLTREVIEQGEPRCMSRSDTDADEKEAALLEKLGFESLLMVCLPERDLCWGLVEVYANGGRFDERQAGLAERIATRAGERLAELERERTR
jgi:transcriptional regulator with GAF, ATPase, and Fis domain